MRSASGTHPGSEKLSGLYDKVRVHRFYSVVKSIDVDCRNVRLMTKMHGNRHRQLIHLDR